jgi:acetyl esterase/lipase
MPDGALLFEKADMSFVSRQWTDLPYSLQSASQRLDIFLPDTGDGPYPILLWIHGGGWMSGDKSERIQLQPLCGALDRGFALVPVNYRFSTEAKFPCQIYDIKTAIRYIRANAWKYCLQSDNIGIWGGSAGGHLAALAALTYNVPALDGICAGYCGASSRVQAAAVISAVTDLYKFAVDEAGGGNALKTGFPYPPADFLLGKSVVSAVEAAYAASPVAYVSPGAPPFYLCHGSRDRIVDAAQSIEFAEKLRNASGNANVTLSLVEGAGHHADPLLLQPEEISAQLDFFEKFIMRRDR